MAEPAANLHAADVTLDRGVVTVTLIGSSIEQHRATAIRQQLRNVLDGSEGRVRHLVLDLGEVGFINSSGLAVFIELHNELKERGASSIAYRPSSDLAGVLEKVKFDKLYRIVRDPVELAKALG